MGKDQQCELIQSGFGVAGNNKRIFFAETPKLLHRVYCTHVYILFLGMQYAVKMHQIANVYIYIYIYIVYTQ